MSEHGRYSGSCSCAAVRLEVSGEPVVAGYCHCDSCRKWSAAPVNAFTLWKPESVRVIQGGEYVGVYNRTKNSDRKWCTRCGGHLLTEHPSMGLVDVYAAIIPSFPFSPGVHVNYQERTLRIMDGLPKFSDLPTEMGGAGTLLPE